jgi:hypothetical protein
MRKTRVRNPRRIKSTELHGIRQNPKPTLDDPRKKRKKERKLRLSCPDKKKDEQAILQSLYFEFNSESILSK